MLRGHEYFSTACLHGEHDYCAASARPDGVPKLPATCKFCQSPCVCDCHGGSQTVGVSRHHWLGVIPYVKVQAWGCSCGPLSAFTLRGALRALRGEHHYRVKAGRCKGGLPGDWDVPQGRG